MNEQTILLNNIKPNEFNPNEMTDAEFLELVQEVKHLGKPPKPIVLRNKGEFFEIVDGEHSYKALKELGHKELQQGWFEIVDYDDTEAKRQTYKRNLGGTNNPVKLGQMFAKAVQESGMSNRQLAESWGLSEGTIRNYLIYATATDLRNDYANLAKLNKEQIKLYLKIAGYAKPIADYWLSCGAIEDALIWFSDEKYNDKDLTVIARAEASFIEIIKQGAEKLLSYKTDFIPLDLTPEDHKRYIQKFKNGIKRASKMASLRKRMEAYFNLGEETKQKVTEYLDLYFNSPLSLKVPEKQIDTLFSLVIKKADNKLEFLLTPEELKQCMQLEKDEGYKTLLNNAMLMIAEKHKIAPSEIKTNSAWGGIEKHLDEIEIEMKAPDYVRQAKWYIPRKFRLAFLEIKIEDEELRKARWELLIKKFEIGDFKNIDHNDQYAIKERMLEIISATVKNEQKQKENEALRQKSELELAQVFMEKIGTALKGSDDARKSLIEKMASNFSKEFLYLFVFLADKYYEERQWKEEYSSLVNEARTLLETKK